MHPNNHPTRRSSNEEAAHDAQQQNTSEGQQQQPQQQQQQPLGDAVEATAIATARSRSLTAVSKSGMFSMQAHAATPATAMPASAASVAAAAGVLAAIPVSYPFAGPAAAARAVPSFTSYTNNGISDAAATAAAAAALLAHVPSASSSSGAGYGASSLTPLQHRAALERERQRERERDRERDRDRMMGRQSSGGESDSDASDGASGMPYTSSVPLRTKRKLRKNNREKQRRSELNDKVCDIWSTARVFRIDSCLRLRILHAHCSFVCCVTVASRFLPSRAPCFFPVR
jgi:hypothetical protein